MKAFLRLDLGGSQNDGGGGITKTAGVSLMARVKGSFVVTAVCVPTSVAASAATTLGACDATLCAAVKKIPRFVGT